MVVGLDIDGVVADFLSSFLRIVEKLVGDGPIYANTITDLNFTGHPHLSAKVIDTCMETVSYDPNFWQGLAPLLSPGEWHTLDLLSCKGQLVFVTHRYERETYDINKVTRDWLKKYGISQPSVYFTQDPKARLVGDLGVNIFMDDRYENCEDVAEHTEAMVLMPDRSYNQCFTHPRVKRICNFKELFAYLPI
ncbi:MAG: hypothetical protein ACE5HC_03485 [Candidatus Binatia bacterium]